MARRTQRAIRIALLMLGLAGVRRCLAQRRLTAYADGPDEWPDLLRSGPYTTVNSEASLEVTTGPAGEACTLQLHLSSPLRTQAMQPRSVPVVLMFSGFQLPASYYTAYAHAFASWGYAALRYDVPGTLLKKVIRDDEEVKFIPLLLDWLHQQGMDPSSALYEIVDTRQVAGFGHSRGAKLATLALTGSISNMKAIVLVDPVDMTTVTRSQGYPSAVEALKVNPRKALIIGAGVTGWCNPQKEGWSAFWPVLSPGSWLSVLLPAGHMQFLDVKGMSAWGLDRLCGAGNITHKVAMHLAGGAAVAWLQSTFRQQESSTEVAAYLDWVTAQQAQGVMTWSIKPELEAGHSHHQQHQKQGEVEEAGVELAGVGVAGQLLTAQA